MAIKYLGGKRLQGTSTERDSHMKVTPPQTSWKELGRTTLTSNGDSIDVGNPASEWALSDSAKNGVSNGALNYDIRRDGSNDVATFDLGATLSDTIWICRFSHTPTAQSHSSGSNVIGFFGLSSTTGGQNSNQDFIGFNFASNDTDGATTKNDTTLVANSVTGQDSTSHTSGTKYYEIKRTSATNVVFTVYNNSDFTGVYRTQTESSLSSSITGLRYFKVANWHASGSGSANFTGNMKDIKIWNGTNSTSGDPTYTPTLTGLTAKDNLMVLTHAIESGVIIPSYQFNGDTGNNYAIRHSISGASDGTAASGGKIQWQNAGTAHTNFGVGIVSNLQGKEKLVIQHGMKSDTGAGNAPNREELVGKWANTSAQITNVNVMNTQSGDFASGSEVVVLGYDNDEADSGTNFWQELASVELTSASDSLDTGTFAAKKYLWVQIYRTRTGSVNSRIRLNGDSGSNYAHRYHGGANSYSESTATSQTSTYSHAATSNDSITEYFFINKADKEKFYLIEEANSGSSGAGNGTSRAEVAGKWVNTSDQITSIQCVNTDSGDLGSGTWIKVWGAD